MTESMWPLCHRLDTVWATMRPDVHRGLRPGATKETLERFADLSLPPDLTTLYTWHDGSDDEHRALDGFFGWSPLAAVGSAKQILDDLENAGDFMSDGWPPGVWWNVGWIPFLQFNCADYICVDVPGSLGQGCGAVFLRLNSEEERVVLAPSVESWLRGHLEITEAGPHGGDEDAWVEHFEGDVATRVRASIAPGFPRSVRAGRGGVAFERFLRGPPHRG